MMFRACVGVVVVFSVSESAVPTSRRVSLQLASSAPALGLSQVASASCSGDGCVMLARRRFDRCGVTLVVDQEFATAKQRSTGAGVWECSEVLSSYLASRPELTSGKAVLELGAGCGLCSMVASLNGAARVVATDGAAKGRFTGTSTRVFFSRSMVSRNAVAVRDREERSRARLSKV